MGLSIKETAELMDIDHALQEAASQDSEPVIDHAALQQRGNRARRRTRSRPLAAALALVVAAAAAATWLTGGTRQSDVVVAPSQQDASDRQLRPTSGPDATAETVSDDPSTDSTAETVSDDPSNGVSETGEDGLEVFVGTWLLVAA